VVTAEASIEVQLAGVALQHPAAQAVVGELLADLRGIPELRARERDATSDGSKGVATEIVVSLGTSGAIAGLVQIVKLWLHRDRRRSLTVSVHDTDDGMTINIEGKNISISTLTDALGSAVRPDQETKLDRGQSAL
jgi:Effector Associated Constant Component 1